VNSADLLTQWCRFGWKYRRIGERSQEEQDWYANRVKYELGLILEKDFCDIFLVVSDAIRWAKDNGIAVGPGRGSVAASVVAWLLRIHEVDPKAHPGLLFERFLDSSRADPPDIDTDFEDDRRGEVREYLERKYGRESVGQVGNFIRYRGKNSLADVARVYNIPHWAKETVGNLLVERSGGDSRFDASIEDTVGMFPNAKAVFDQFPDLWKATRLEGNVRGMSVHAAGLVLSNGPMTDVCAIYEKDGVQVMSIDKYDVEYAGAIKLDFLGLTTMSIIGRTLEMIGMTLDELYQVPLDDPQVLAKFSDVDVVGIFQFEGRATRLVTRDVQARNFTELADINALSRPGPLFSGTTAMYVDVRHGKRAADRLHPIVDAITERTKGQIIYQEQILQILRDLGGFDWFSVGQIRRIISKKLGEAAFQMSEGQFQEGAQRLYGIDHKLSDKIWKLMVTSGTYSFVTAHAVSYTLIGYYCMWLKVHHPLEFYAASLTKAQGDDEQRFRLMQDADRHGIRISPPRIGISRAGWVAHHKLGTFRTQYKGELVAGWKDVPGIGPKVSQRIQEYCAENNISEWGQLQAIPGIGAKTVDKMADFSLQADPFGLHTAENTMRTVRQWLESRTDIPAPTHTGTEVAAIQVDQEYGSAREARKKYGEGPQVIYLGIVRERNMQDAVENRRSRTGEEAEDIIKDLYRPGLLAYCSLRCYDDTEEEIYLRVNRFTYPNLKKKIEAIRPGSTVVLCIGNRIAGFGTPVMVKKLYIIDPDKD
jgi:DNA polymerase III subunit alpha